MADINLLPQELKPNKTVLIMSKKLRKVSIILGFFLLIVAIAMGSVYFFYFKRTEGTLTKQTELENQIRSLEETEQRLVLIKDRVSKIRSVTSSGSIAEEVNITKRVFDLLPPGSHIANITIDRDVVRLGVVAENLTSASEYLKAVTAISGVKYVNLISFDFNPTFGYNIELNFIVAPEDPQPQIN